jgi:hypothetical protein
MQITARHREAEARFRELMTEAEIPAPDSVEDDPDSVVLWHDQKLAVIVEFDEDGPACG